MRVLSCLFRFLAVLSVGLASAAVAHVTVWPKESPAAAYEKYVVRIPNEKDTGTVSVEVQFPPSVRVQSFEQKPGWRADPLEGPDGRVTGVRWTGDLAPREFVELGLIAVNPDGAEELVWSATQTYADGSVVSWSGPAGSATPAARTRIVAAQPAPHAH